MGKQNDSHQLLACPLVEKNWENWKILDFFNFSYFIISFHSVPLSLFFPSSITAAKKDQQQLVRIKRGSILLNCYFFPLSKKEMLKTSQVKLKCSIHFKCFLAKICHIPIWNFNFLYQPQKWKLYWNVHWRLFTWQIYRESLARCYTVICTTFFQLLWNSWIEIQLAEV